MIVYGHQTIDTVTLYQVVEKKLVQNQRIKKLLDYYDGDQEISRRHYADPEKPNNRITVNYCKHVSDFLTAYLVGVPVELEGASAELRTVMKYNDDPHSTQTAVNYMNTAGFGCELFYMDEDGNARYTPINPLECIFFMNDDLQRDITAFARLVQLEDEKGYTVTLYTADTMQTFLLAAGTGQLVAISEKAPHYWRDVPVNIYENGENLQGSFEQAIPMQDALNKIYSDNVNDFEQFVDAYLVLEGMAGTTPEDIAEMKAQRVLLPPPDSKAYWLTKTVNKDHIKQLQDDLRAQILETCNCPDLKELAGDGFSTSLSGASIRMRLIKTEIAAAKQESNVRKAIMRKVELLYNVLNISGGSADYTAVTPVFTRNFLMTDEEIAIESGSYRYTASTAADDTDTDE